MSRDCLVAFPHDTNVFLQFIIVIFPDHTHLLFLLLNHLKMVQYIMHFNTVTHTALDIIYTWGNF